MELTDGQLFALVVKAPTAQERRDAIRALCGGDVQQESRLLKLVRAHEQVTEGAAQGFILDRAGEVFRSLVDNSPLQPGQKIGAYRLVQKIGEGGTGIVYRAVQEHPIRRDVALKLLKPGMDSQQILARFALERDTLVQLDHPGITRIYDAGTQTNGRPYFVMELVRNAVEITRYCRIHQLSLHDRIKLMIQLCEIIQHAHQRGFIHRDLKPSNILLENHDAGAVVIKVIDFGITKVISDGGSGIETITSLGERFGTPEYMSPEQALNSSVGIDTRTDVYSLGVLLYEMLTGETPMAISATTDSAVNWLDPAYWKQSIKPPSRAVNDRVTDCAAPADAVSKAGRVSFPQRWKESRFSSRTASPQISRELDCICLRALAFDRADRYGTVSDLAKDLQRLISGLPIEASGLGWQYRAKKWIGRNILITAAASILLLMFALIGQVTYLLARRAASAERQIAQLQADKEALQAILDSSHAQILSAQEATDTILRAVQITMALECAALKHVEAILASQDEHNQTTDDSYSDEPLIQQVALVPHSRLHVRGDWQWASSVIELQMRNFQSAVRVSSSEIAQRLNAHLFQLPRQSPDALALPNIETARGLVPAVRGRLRFQQVLLNELYNTLDPHDPLVGEVLDNCALYALDMRDYSAAEVYLRKACEVWETLGHDPTRAIQSRLFLVESLVAASKFAEAKSTLVDLNERLKRLAFNQVGVMPMRDHLMELDAQLAKCLAEHQSPSRVSD